MNTRKEIATLLDRLNLTGEGVEIGVQKGRFSTQMLKGSKLSHYSMVDSWKHYPTEMYPDAANVSDEAQEAIYTKVKSDFDGKWGKRVEILRGESLAMVGEFDDGELDFAYIDANHTYEAVKADIEAWYPKVKAGGVFAGHDYVKRKNYGVIQAVDEFALANGLGKPLVTASEKSPSWVHIKPHPKTDVVIALGSGSKRNNEEVRYAIRSAEKNLKNLGKVFVVGEQPKWLTNATGIQYSDLKRQKDINIIGKIKEACDSGSLSERFVFVSDDQMLLQPSGWEDLNVGVRKEFNPSDTYYDGNLWKQRLRDTLKRFPDGAKYYQPHGWMPMERSKFLDMCSSYDWEKGNCIIASLYYNHVGGPVADNGATHVWNPRGDPSAITKAVDGRQMLGYNDRGADRVLAWAAQTFPEPSKYEIVGVVDSAGKTLIEASIAKLKTLSGHEDLKAKAAELTKKYGPTWDLDCEGKSEVNRVLMNPLKKILFPNAKKPQPKVRSGCKTCGDKSKTKAPDAPTPPDEMGPMGERDCIECCLKHIEVAFVQIAEFITNNEYRRELRMARGNLGCAEAHAARKMPDMAKRIREARLLLSGMGHEAPEALRKVDGIADGLDKTLMII